jgi:hypothetical protein
MLDLDPYPAAAKNHRRHSFFSGVECPSVRVVTGHRSKFAFRASTSTYNRASLCTPSSRRLENFSIDIFVSQVLLNE